MTKVEIIVVRASEGFEIAAVMSMESSHTAVIGEVYKTTDVEYMSDSAMNYCSAFCHGCFSHGHNCCCDLCLGSEACASDSTGVVNPWLCKGSWRLMSCCCC